MSIPVTTTFSFEGYRIREYKGLVRGIIVRSDGRGIFERGEDRMILAFTETCEQASLQAFELLVQHALDLRANAVVGLRYGASKVAGCTEVLCYGTAVVIEPAE